MSRFLPRAALSTSANARDRSSGEGCAAVEIRRTGSFIVGRIVVTFGPTNPGHGAACSSSRLPDKPQRMDDANEGIDAKTRGKDDTFRPGLRTRRRRADRPKGNRMQADPSKPTPASAAPKSGRLAVARLVRTLVVPLTLALPPMLWVADATRRASLTTLGRDQGIFQYIGWAIAQGERDY